MMGGGGRCPFSPPPSASSFVGARRKIESNFNPKLKPKSEFDAHYGTQSHDETASIARGNLAVSGLSE